MALITIYTPTYQRPKALTKCIESVQAQTCQDFEHIVYHDRVGEGIDGMFARVVASSPTFQGEYVYILQDDDWLADAKVIADVKAFIEANDKPPVIICQSRKHHLRLPTKWGTLPPWAGTIDLGNFIVRKDIFQVYREGLLTGRYEADFDFIRRIWDAGIEFTWYPRLICESDQFGQGQPE